MSHSVRLIDSGFTESYRLVSGRWVTNLIDPMRLVSRKNISFTFGGMGLSYLIPSERLGRKKSLEGN